MIALQFALRRRMMMNASKGLPISSLPLGTLIRVADSDGGDGVANYEIADINNLVPGGVVLVRKNIYSKSEFGSNPPNYPNSTLDNLISTTIYNKMPQQLRNKMMDVSFTLVVIATGSMPQDITRKMFALTRNMVGFGNNLGVAESKALQLYTSNASRVKTFNGSAATWWLSSQNAADGGAWCVELDGSDNNFSPSSSYDIIPAFVIPQSVMLEDSANEDGSYNIMMEAEGGSASISELPLGTLINVSTDGGADLPYYEIADKDNLVNGGVVLVRKYVYSKPECVSSTTYPNHSLDSLIKTDIYNNMLQKLRDKMMDVTFTLYKSGDITRKMFALTWTMVGFGDNHGVTEGKALQLYTSNDSRIKKFNGSATYWWLSSQYSRYVRCVSMRGTDYDLEPSLSAGVVPAFVIPSKTPYDPTPNMYGAYYLIL